jgi:hypothetical protein
MTNTINYYYTNIMMNLFLETPTESPTAAPITYKDIGNFADFFDVFQGPMLDSLYWEKWYNEQNVTQYGMIYYENKLLGVPRLRQMRVKKNSCKVHKMFKNAIDSCYDSYSFFNEDQAPFGKYETSQTAMTDTAYLK